MIESPEKADRREKEKARNPHDSWLFCERTTKKIFLPNQCEYLNPRKELFIQSMSPFCSFSAYLTFFK